MAATRPTRRVEALAWVLIYGGLIAVVLGVFAAAADEAVSWTLIVAGGIAAVVGCVLVYARSRMKESP
jgi:membrane protein DedA with SNARE-associated domain